MNCDKQSEQREGHVSKIYDRFELRFIAGRGCIEKRGMTNLSGAVQKRDSKDFGDVLRKEWII